MMNTGGPRLGRKPSQMKSESGGGRVGGKNS